MRKLIAGISIVLLVFLNACAKHDAPAAVQPSDDAPSPSPSATATAEPTPIPTPIGVDRTVDISGYKPFVPNLENSTVLTATYDEITNDLKTSIEDLMTIPENIVIGEVVEIYYTDVAGIDAIYCNYKLSEVLKGGLGVNDTITAVHYGGYMRGDVYTNNAGLILMRYLDGVQKEVELTSEHLLKWDYGVPNPAIGDRYALFLSQKAVPEGVYGNPLNCAGTYRVDGEELTFIDPVYYAASSDLCDITNLAQLRTIVEEYAAPPTPVIPAPVSTPLPEGRDLTTDLSGFDLFSRKENDVELQIHYPDLLEFGAVSVEHLSYFTELIIVGEVIDVLYSDKDYSWEQTFLNVKLHDVLKGDLSPGDTITLRYFGGYIRGSTWAEKYGENSLGAIPLSENYLIRYDFFKDVKHPKTGEKHLLFLLSDDEIDGLYQSSIIERAAMRSFLVNGESLTCVLPGYIPLRSLLNPPNVSTLDELRELIATAQPPFE